MTVELRNDIDITINSLKGEIQMLKDEYIQITCTKEATLFLNNIVYHFHDTVLKSMYYESGSFRNADDNSFMPINNVRKLVLRYESQLNQGFTLELIFNQVERLNLVPTTEEYDSLDWDRANFMFDNGNVYFMQFPDTIAQLEKHSAENTWLIAKSVAYKIWK